MARQKQQDQNAANQKPRSGKAGNKPTGAEEGAKNKRTGSQGKVDPMGKD